MIQEDSKLTNSDKVNALSQYVQLNLSAFQSLRNKNYKLAMSQFEKCIDIAKDLDDMKHVESLTNHGICQFFCGNFEEAFDYLEKAKEISTRLYDGSFDKQIQFLHLRVISNLSLTALSLNKISECRAQFNTCIDIIRNSSTSQSDKAEMLKEMVFIFFRLDSLSKYYEVNQNILENNIGDDVWNNENATTKMVNKCLFGLHKSLRENNFQYWFNVLSEEVSKSKRMRDSSGFVFLLINQMAACYCCKGKVNDNLKTTLTNLVKYYQDQYNKDLKFKEKNINTILSDFKARIEVAVEIYKRIWDLENELADAMSNNNNSNQNNINNGNKYLIKILFKHAINYLSNDENANTDVKNQIELALKLIENDEIDCSMISIMNINNEITKSLKILINNLTIIKKKIILKSQLNRFKYNTLNYIHMSECMEKKYLISLEYLKEKLEKLSTGYELIKFNFTSKGTTKHVYQIGMVKDQYHLLIYKTKNDLQSGKQMKVIPLTEMIKISFCCESDNLKKRIASKQFKDFKPWLFLSLHFAKRTIDLYFDDDNTVNEWFLGLYYYMWKISERKDNVPKINLFFFNKLKMKLLYKMKEMKGELEILDQIKTFANENEVEFQSMPIAKAVLLYMKIVENLNTNQIHE